jgi:hypothetical protein
MWGSNTKNIYILLRKPEYEWNSANGSLKFQKQNIAIVKSGIFPLLGLKK